MLALGIDCKYVPLDKVAKSVMMGKGPLLLTLKSTICISCIDSITRFSKFPPPANVLSVGLYALSNFDNCVLLNRFTNVVGVIMLLGYIVLTS